MNWLMQNADRIAMLAGRQAAYNLMPMAVGLLLSVPLGRLFNATGRMRSILIALCGALYAIPSLPLLMLLPSLLGTKILNPVNLEVALTIYAVALLAQSCANALASVDPELIDAASSIGYGRMRRFLEVELPQAGPVILANLRVVSASSISLITVGSLTGVESLGSLFLEGYQRDFPLEIITGIIATLAIALAYDLALVWLGNLLMPWKRAERRTSTREENDE